MLEKTLLLELKNVSVKVPQRELLQNIELELRSHEITTVIGPNGAGKTTLVKLVLGLIPPSEGRLIQHTNYSLGYVPQKISIDPTLPLNVDRFLSIAGPYDESDRREVLQQVNAQQLQKQPIHSLSGGEFQRVLLARALLRKPRLLVLDEPTQGMDVPGQIELYRLINQIKSFLECSVLMVSHDLHLVMASTDHVICLNQHICCSGHPQAVREHPEYLQLFGQSEDEMLALYTHHHDHTHHDCHNDGSIEDNSNV